jgi:hypothetical protein
VVLAAQEIQLRKLQAVRQILVVAVVVLVVGQLLFHLVQAAAV